MCPLFGVSCKRGYTVLMISQECQEYDEVFASMFGKFLDKDPNASQPTANNEDTPGVDFVKYIEVHLQARKCPSFCSRLWSVDY